MRSSNIKRLMTRPIQTFRSPKLLTRLEILLRAAGDDDGTVFRALLCYPDTEGILAIVGEKNGVMLVLSFERFKSLAAEWIWKDAQSSANSRASARTVAISVGSRKK